MRVFQGKREGYGRREQEAGGGSEKPKGVYGKNRLQQQAYCRILRTIQQRNPLITYTICSKSQ